MSESTIIESLEDGVLTLSLNRPEHKNIMTGEMLAGLIKIFRGLNDRDEVRCVVLTGSGDFFCGGTDISSGGDTFNFDAHDNIDDVFKTDIEGGGVLALEIFECLKPVIIANNGPCVGIGATFQLAADIRVMSEDAFYLFPFTRRGISLESCSTWFLPRLVGMSKAMEWMLTARRVSAKEAEQAGLVNAVYPQEQVLSEAQAIAKDIAQNTSQISVALTRQMLWRGQTQPHPRDASVIETKSLFALGKSPDAMEGVMSFLEKREAKFPGKVSTDMPDFYPWWLDD